MCRRQTSSPAPCCVPTFLPALSEARTSPASMESVCPSGPSCSGCCARASAGPGGHGLAPSRLPGPRVGAFVRFDLQGRALCVRGAPCSPACGHLLVPASFAGRTFRPPGRPGSLVEKPPTARRRSLPVLFPRPVRAATAPGQRRELRRGSELGERRPGRWLSGCLPRPRGGGGECVLLCKAPAAVRVGTAPRVSAPPDAAPRSGRRAPSVRSGPLRFLPATTRRFPALLQLRSSPSLRWGSLPRCDSSRRLPSAARPLPLGLSVSAALAGTVAVRRPFVSRAKAWSVLLTFPKDHLWFIDCSVSCFQRWLRLALNPTGTFPEVHLLVVDSGSLPSPGSASGRLFPEQRQHFRGRPPRPSESPVPGTPVLALI